MAAFRRRGHSRVSVVIHRTNCFLRNVLKNRRLRPHWRC
ncbi:hypothetical protein STVIR_2908 [Streptomyces viridochromogenes Tue57]|uniref:Uncharacterized protein n=1 Tax=Streptomyces viridochromogenes Tue57 TaxID=1160705 RepID=L8PIC9_STRVR|nr:hypothetical protein STVIR_2908 [Streptomyces viridochromogenes Tue57]